MQGISLTHHMLHSFFAGSLSFLSGVFLSRVWLHFYLGCFSYASHAGFVFIRVVSLTNPVLVRFLCREFLLHIACCIHFCVGSLSDTSHATFTFMRGVSLIHSKLPSFLSGEFYTCHAGFFLCREFLLHILS